MSIVTDAPQSAINSGLPEPYYDQDGITIYHGDCREILPLLEPGSIDLVLTDPPYPNNAGHFIDGIRAAEQIMQTYVAPRWMVFWHALTRPPVPLPLVAHHIWHRSNTNRPDNYEPIYEFANESERASRVMSYPVVYPGLTGCYEATGHPTQKNVKLMRDLIAMRRDAQALLDPFMGSGTTLRAAKDLGRKAIGIEIEEKYVEIAVKRLQQSVLPLEVS